MLELRACERLRHLDLRARKTLLRVEAELDLLVERDREGVDLDVRLERAGLRRERRELAPTSTGCASERAGATGGVSGALVAQGTGACEAPGSVDEHPHADAFRLHVADRFDIAVLRRDGLRPLEHTARVRIRSAGADRCVDGIPAEVPHGSGRYTDRALTRWWRNW